MERKRWRRVWGLLVVAAVYLLCLPDMARAADEERVIRVGYPIQKGFTEITPEGVYRGYTYDYLREISQYTNWQYEFVTVDGTMDEQLVTLLEMLQNGEIDILGAMNYSEQLAQILSYPGYNYGTAYTTLSVLQNNTKFMEFNYATFDNIRVAVFSKSGKRSEVLDEFARGNGFHVQQMVCESDEQQLELLKSGRADAVLRMDVSDYEMNLRVIARMDPTPFYFAVTKGNQVVVSGLNRALEMINATNPYYSTQLYEQYFPMDSGMVLSDEERQYVEQADVIKAAVMLGNAPFQYRTRDGVMTGISCEVLDYITEQTGLQFELIPFEDYDEFDAAMKGGLVDVAVGVTSNYELAQEENYTMTVSYAYVPLLLAMNETCDNPSVLEGKKLAMARGSYCEGGYKGDLRFYNTIEECIDAVHRKEADYCYGNSYSVQYYVNNNNYRNINLIGQPEAWSQKVCIGIQKPADITLLSILNKALRYLPDEVAIGYLYQNIYDTSDMSVMEYAQRNPREMFLFLLMLAMGCALVALAGSGFVRRRGMIRKALESERYEQLSELSNEYLYEYDIKEDRLKMTEQTAAFLGSARTVDHPCEQEEAVFRYMISEIDSSAEHECALPSGISCWVRIVLKVVSDRAGRPWYAVGKLIDIREEKDAKERLEFQAQRDGLTTLYNAATSRKRITQVLESESDRHSGVMIILDVDTFKQVNDELGHYTGDEVLCDLANTLKSGFRPEDIVGRFGGDEFAIFMKDVKDPAVVRARCEAVLEQFGNVTLEKHGRRISLSIGAAMVEPDRDYDTLYRLADQALYQVKERGRAGIEIV